jgi:hypothetical protein
MQSFLKLRQCFNVVGASTSGPALSIIRGGLLGLLQSGPNGVFLAFPLRELLLPPIPATHDGGEKALCRSAEKSPAAPLPPMPPTFAAPLGPEELGKEPGTPSRACWGGGGAVLQKRVLSSSFGQRQASPHPLQSSFLHMNV